MIIKASVHIKASLKEVWETFTDLTCWQDWSTVMTKVSSDTDRLTEGRSFKFCIRPFYIPVHLEPVVEEVVPMKRIVWSGRKHGISARHEFTFSAKDGSVKLSSKEIFTGIMVKSFNFLLPRQEMKDLSVLMLLEIKKAVEAKETYSGRGEGRLWEKKSG
jgi:hypothetical protein